MYNAVMVKSGSTESRTEKFKKSFFGSGEIF